MQRDDRAGGGWAVGRGDFARRRREHRQPDHRGVRKRDGGAAATSRPRESFTRCSLRGEAYRGGVTGGALRGRAAVILAQQLSIHEFRGIRDLTIELGGKNFAICGPNGTGKSGVVDALEFALTGNISRL